jgi:hypothetical protein
MRQIARLKLFRRSLTVTPLTRTNLLPPFAWPTAAFDGARPFQELIQLIVAVLMATSSMSFSSARTNRRDYVCIIVIANRFMPAGLSGVYSEKYQFVASMFFRYQ